jgi:probable F420-dependent oxidoreductase
LKFSVQIPTDRVEAGEEFTSAAAIAQMARAAEVAGFDAGYVTEHPFPADAWLGSGGHHALDPFVALAAAAGATKQLKLHTNILVLAYRNPFLTAKAIASLDVLSGGRVIVGIAAGYLEGEYRALGADFANRNQRTDEALVAMKAAWSGESTRFVGEGFAAEGNTMLPTPVQRPHPPVWVGGNTKLAIRRVVQHAQGWSPFPVAAKYSERTRTAAIETPAELGGKVELLNELARAEGRSDPIDVNFVPFGNGMNVRALPEADAFLEQIRALEAVGVTWLSVGMPTPSRAGYLESLERFGQEVIAQR